MDVNKTGCIDKDGFLSVVAHDLVAHHISSIGLDATNPELLFEVISGELEVNGVMLQSGALRKGLDDLRDQQVQMLRRVSVLEARANEPKAPVVWPRSAGDHRANVFCARSTMPTLPALHL
eukprot:CAMPEP_0176176732 /NCGR_PEP_ID=MMETSP0120_2-20121206/90522_1 /TAXON_ID=160619 /ORGANISM="Kryptoperidinium foliaceum, Strain CCMP 1326" /LENGTH=120 /DNA_ID=CAMNT_0017514777 /DNA_START=36 /DNA_END=399 /DNA_ORIENTATION=-